MITFFRKRLSEWFTSWIILALGFVMFNPTPIFGAMLIIVAIARMIALFINGNMPNGTPIIRTLGSLVGAFVFGQLVGQIAATYPHGTASLACLVIYSILMGFDILNSFYSMSDVVRHRRIKGA